MVDSSARRCSNRRRRSESVEYDCSASCPPVWVICSAVEDWQIPTHGVLDVGCPRSLWYGGVCHPAGRSYCVRQNSVWRSQSIPRLSVLVDSLAEMLQPSTRLNRRTWVKVIWNDVSSSRSPAGRACNASNFTSS
jgi:hypothetical protein